MNLNNPFPGIRPDRLPQIVIAVTTLAVLAISIYSLSFGWFIIFQNLFYVPIIIACVYYTKKGFVFSVVLSVVYFLLILAFTKDSAVITQALIRVFLFVFIAGIITFLSIRRKRAEDRAKASAGEWAETFDALADGVSIHNFDYEILNINKALCEILGKKKEELIGKKCYQVFHGRNAPLDLCPLRKVLETKKKETLEYFEPALNAWLLVSASPIFNEKGELEKVVHRVVHVVRDITERRKREDELTKLRKAVETSGEAVFMTDRDGQIIYVNLEFSRLYGYTAQEVVGKTTPRILKSGAMKPADYEAFWKTILSGQVVRGELINKTRDGRLIPIEGSANPIQDEAGNITGFLAIQRDITERKRMEEEIKKKMREFETFYKAAMGREDKILELKKRVEELEHRP